LLAKIKRYSAPLAILLVSMLLRSNETIFFFAFFGNFFFLAGEMEQI